MRQKSKTVYTVHCNVSAETQPQLSWVKLVVRAELVKNVVNLPLVIAICTRLSRYICTKTVNRGSQAILIDNHHPHATTLRAQPGRRKETRVVRIETQQQKFLTERLKRKGFFLQCSFKNQRADLKQASVHSLLSCLLQSIT